MYIYFPLTVKVFSLFMTKERDKEVKGNQVNRRLKCLCHTGESQQSVIRGKDTQEHFEATFVKVMGFPHEDRPKFLGVVT